jgi:hypothetical protein
MDRLSHLIVEQSLNNHLNFSSIKSSISFSPSLLFILTFYVQPNEQQQQQNDENGNAHFLCTAFFAPVKWNEKDVLN